MSKKIQRYKLAQFKSLELLAKQVVEGFITGLHKSPFHGFSVEFAEHRLYNPGESTRHIDWKLYGKTEKLFTKKYEEETNLRCQIVVDCSASMFYPDAKDSYSKFEFATYTAASIIELLKKQRDAVGLSLYQDALITHTEAKSSPAHHRYLFAALEKHLVDYKSIGQKSGDTVGVLHSIAELCHKRSLIVLFTDFLDNPNDLDSFFQALMHLKHNKHEVLIFHTVQRKTELDFELENRPHELIDMETGQQIKVQPAEFKEKYQQSIREHFSNIELTAKKYGIDYTLADIDKEFNEVLLQYLIKRQRMR